jgi:hypothetical protein
MTTRQEKLDRRDQLFDHLADQPGTIKEMMAALGVNELPLRHTIRELRLFLGETDEINLVCEPQGHREPWLYRLVGNLDAARPWQDNQMRHLESRLESSLAIAKSMASAFPDGRRVEAKKARRVVTVLSRLMEDLDELLPDPADAGA